MPLTGKLGTLAHNTAYPIVQAKIESLGYHDVRANKGMFTADGVSKINRKRPDWQSPTGEQLLLWEMKPNTEVQALNDIAFYIEQAKIKGVDAVPGPELGIIGEEIPVQGLENVFIDIISPTPGVVIYNAYTIKQTPESIMQIQSSTSRNRDMNIDFSKGWNIGLTAFGCLGLFIYSLVFGS